MFRLSDIAYILNEDFVRGSDSEEFEEIVFDTRKIVSGHNALFVALAGIDRDGHAYIKAAFAKGVRNFLVTSILPPECREANCIVVSDVLNTLQKWAACHRQSLNTSRFIGITGSNGKTIVKEWMYQALKSEKTVGKSPRSYNSKIGVALSILGIKKSSEIAIIEAGISQAGEMGVLEKMLKPDLGVFTHLGDAHSSGFISREEKLAEKLSLFKDAKALVFAGDEDEIVEGVKKHLPEIKAITWGKEIHNFVQLLHSDKDVIQLRFREKIYEIKISGKYGFLENLMHVITCGFYLGLDCEVIERNVAHFDQVEMRLEQIQGINQSIIINDAYVLDTDSLKLSLDYLSNLRDKKRKTLILSDFPGKQMNDEDALSLQKLVDGYSLNRVITVGSFLDKVVFKGDRLHFNSYDALNQEIANLNWERAYILIKGSREYRLERLVKKLERSSHSALLEIDLTALHENISLYKEKLQPGVGLIAVIKASAYGGGIEKIAESIASHDPLFLAVAYIDEGIELRKSGIKNRIIVLNPDPHRLSLAVEFLLEIEIYNFYILERYIELTHGEIDLPSVHVKLDTGMHRMGFRKDNMERLITMLASHKKIQVATVFSHLSASEDENLDDYSLFQIRTFKEWCNQLDQGLNCKIPRHILNSEGILRFPNAQFDMVRLGLGMYGISSELKGKSKVVHTLSAQIISIKTFKKGDSIGYSRAEILKEATIIGVVNIGYADGLMRSLSKGKGQLWYRGNKVNIVGNVCMDVSMINLNGIKDPQIGDMVEVFGPNNSIEQLAISAGTIPYEILSRVSSRIVRKYTIDG